MRLNILQALANQRVLWVAEPRSLVLRGYTAWWRDGQGNRTEAAALPMAWPYRVASSARLLRQGLRLGIHHLWPLPDGSLVGVAKRVLIRAEPNSRTLRVVGRLRFGNKPAFNGLCVDPRGLVYYGEYCPNVDRTRPMGVYRSEDQGKSYRRVLEFAPGQIRHVHLIQYDPFADCLWLGTGDRDQECQLLCSADSGTTWKTVGGGSQLWRTVGLAFTPEAVYWGTDAGSDTGTHPNHIVRWCRTTGQQTLVHEVQGPCHGIAALGDGTLLVSTGVERGANEKDRLAHLWAKRRTGPWEEVAAWKKDPWPGVLQFGVVHFAHTEAPPALAHFTTRGLSRAGETYHIAQILG